MMNSNWKVTFLKECDGIIEKRLIEDESVFMDSDEVYQLIDDYELDDKSDLDVILEFIHYCLTLGEYWYIEDIDNGSISIFDRGRILNLEITERSAVTEDEINQVYDSVAGNYEEYCRKHYYSMIAKYSDLKIEPRG